MTDAAERLLRDIGPDLRVLPAGLPARARLDQPEQPAQLGLRLRRLRRRGRRAERPRHGPDAQRPRVRESLAAAGHRSARGDRLRRRLPQHLQRLGRSSTTWTASRNRTGRSSSRPARSIEATCDRNAARALPAVHVGPADALLRRRPASTSRSGRRTWPRPGPSWGTRPTPSRIVGRRERTRGLFLDRRAFLTSYDPTQDDAEGTILTRILQAVFPVCGGHQPRVLLLPRRQHRLRLRHEAAAQRRGAAGGHGRRGERPADRAALADGRDPRAGPLLFVIETTPEAMLGIMDRNEGIGRLCRNGWVRLAVLDPELARDQRLRERGVPAATGRRPRSSPGPPPRSNGIAAGATTWSSRRSSGEGVEVFGWADVASTPAFDPDRLVRSDLLHPTLDAPDPRSLPPGRGMAGAPAAPRLESRHETSSFDFQM